MKVTKEQIIEALENCSNINNYAYCQKCQYKEYGFGGSKHSDNINCDLKLMRDAANVIKKGKAIMP